MRGPDERTRNPSPGTLEQRLRLRAAGSAWARHATAVYEMMGRMFGGWTPSQAHLEPEMRRSGKAVPVRERDSLRAVLDSDLREQMVDMGFDSRLVHEELCGDLLVGESAGDQRENLGFSGRQAACGR